VPTRAVATSKYLARYPRVIRAFRDRGNMVLGWISRDFMSRCIAMTDEDREGLGGFPCRDLSLGPTNRGRTLSRSRGKSSRRWETSMMQMKLTACEFSKARGQRGIRAGEETQAGSR